MRRGYRLRGAPPERKRLTGKTISLRGRGVAASRICSSRDQRSEPIIGNRQNTQYLVRTSDGLDYCRVEPWEGGIASAETAAQRLGGYVVELDETLVATDIVVADFRV